MLTLSLLLAFIVGAILGGLGIATVVGMALWRAGLLDEYLEFCLEDDPPAPPPSSSDGAP